MVKSAFARKQLEKKISKYKKEIKLLRCKLMLTSVGFGRNFKKDPWDCGDTKCGLCHREPKGKSNPVKIQMENLDEKEQLLDLFTSSDDSHPVEKTRAALRVVQ